MEETHYALVTDLVQRKLRCQSFKDPSGNYFNFPKHAACTSFEDGVFICGGKGPTDAPPREIFMSTCNYIKNPGKLFTGPSFSIGRYDMGITVVEGGMYLMLTGGFREDHMATCERLNLKTFRMDVQERRSDAKEASEFGGYFETIDSLQHKRSNHACCCF